MALASRLAALVALASLSACGAAADDPLLGVARDLSQGVFNRSEAAPAVDPRQVLTRDLINQAAVPLILVDTPQGTSSTATRIQTNRTNETWQGNGDVSFTLSREGVLSATRGLGHDLFAADIAATRAALASRRSGPVERLYVRVTGDLAQINDGYTCEIQYSGPERVASFGITRNLTRATETCSQHRTGQTVENRYWIDGTGFAWASEQWVGPEVGHFRFERLYR
ncbi:YjbF family lipoprotein [Rhodobacteraceae bacterium M385]|nr:YjbF family lipoprotein [Rhodobacteraceae bacterium M385]